MTRLLGGFAIGAASGVALNVGFFWQHTVASGLSSLSFRRPLASLGALFSNGRWLAGWALGLSGWALYAAALWIAPLSVVQAASAGGVGLLAWLAGRRARSPIPRYERAGVGLAVAGLVLLGVSLGSTGGIGGAAAGRGGTFAVPLAVGLAACVALAVVGVGPLGERLNPGAGFGIAAGALYAAGDVALKGAALGVARPALIGIVLLSHGAGFVATQAGFQRGGVVATAGVSRLLNDSVPIAAGLVVFHESLPRGPDGALRIAAFALVVAGAALIARRTETGDAAPSSGVRGDAFAPDPGLEDGVVARPVRDHRKAG